MTFITGEKKQIYKIFEKYGLAGNTVGYTDPNRIWKIILENKRIRFENHLDVFEASKWMQDPKTVFQSNLLPLTKIMHFGAFSVLTKKNHLKKLLY